MSTAYSLQPLRQRARPGRRGGHSRTARSRARSCRVGRLGEGDRVPIRIGNLHVANTVRVGLDRFMLDALDRDTVQDSVAPTDGQGDAARARLRCVWLGEESHLALPCGPEGKGGARVRYCSPGEAPPWPSPRGASSDLKRARPLWAKATFSPRARLLIAASLISSRSSSGRRMAVRGLTPRCPAARSSTRSWRRRCGPAKWRR